MKLARLALTLTFAAATVYFAVSAYASYELLRFYTDVERDPSIAEIYEVELWFKVPLSAMCGIATLFSVVTAFRSR